MDKPSTQIGYSEDDLQNVKKCCLYLATKLGSLADDIVIVGGLVPSLLTTHDSAYPESGSDSLFGVHSGTKDLDLGLALSILEEERYTELSALLRSAGFSPDQNNGNPTRQRWRIKEPHSVTVDFLIAPSREDDSGGDLRDIEHDFAAIITPGLHLAFADRKKIALEGYTLFNEWAERDVWVCGAGAFIVLKALALDGRGENKDAYDLCYMLNSTIFDESSLGGILSFLTGNWEDPDVQKALAIIRRDFGQRDGIGPMRTARFLESETNDGVISDAFGLAQSLLQRVDALSKSVAPE